MDFETLDVAVPRGRNGSFELQILPKHERRWTGFDDKLISMYACGMSTRDTEGHLRERYGVEVSATLISQVTEALMENVRAWESRWSKMRHEGRVENRAVFVAVGVTPECSKEVLGLWTSATKEAKLWAQTLTEMRSRGVQDILIACVDGLKSFPDAIATVYPHTEVQLCIVHRVPQQPGVCELEGTQTSGGRSAQHLSRAHSGGRIGDVGHIRGALERQVCNHRQALAAALSGHQPAVCLSGERSGVRSIQPTSSNRCR